jgi:hypothetical protein
VKGGLAALAVATVGLGCGAAPENVTELPPISAIDSPYTLPSSVPAAPSAAVVAAPATSARPRAP